MNSIFHRSGICCFILLVLGGPVSASEPDDSDNDETIQARRVLLENSQLARLNLGVHVREHIAVLWGPVPSGLLRLSAEIRLRSMLPSLEVRNELFVVEPPVNRVVYLPDVLPGVPRSER
jgi:hypothetical protein